LCNGFDRIEFRGNAAMSLHSKMQYGIGAAGLVPLWGGEIGQKDFPCGDNMLAGPKYSKFYKIPDTAGLVFLYQQYNQVSTIKSYIIKADNKVIATIYSGGYYPYLSTPGKREFTKLVLHTPNGKVPLSCLISKQARHTT
jgi:hypothetical protein